MWLLWHISYPWALRWPPRNAQLNRTATLWITHGGKGFLFSNLQGWTLNRTSLVTSLSYVFRTRPTLIYTQFLNNIRQSSNSVTEELFCDQNHTLPTFLGTPGTYELESAARLQSSDLAENYHSRPQTSELWFTRTYTDKQKIGPCGRRSWKQRCSLAKFHVMVWIPFVLFKM